MSLGTSILSESTLSEGADLAYGTITPAVGSPLGGQVVEITGTGFRVPSITLGVPPTGQGAPTVMVTFDGVEAEYVHVISSELIRVAVPTAELDPFSAPGTVDSAVSRVTYPPVDVVISNIDDEGNVIPGETLTLSQAYTYEQPLIRPPAGDSPLLQVFRKFLDLIMRNVTSNVYKSTNTDFGVDGAVFTVLSEAPSVMLRLSFPSDPEYSYHDNEPTLVESSPGVYQEYKMQRTVMMVASLVVSAVTDTELFHLVDAMHDLPLGSPWLKVPGDPNWAIGSIPNRYPIEWVEDFSQIGTPNNANVQAYAATWRVRGIPIVHGDPSQVAIRNISTINLTSMSMNSDTAAPVTVAV